jgi:cytochrome c oxidase cbb3-type subunit 3
MLAAMTERLRNAFSWPGAVLGKLSRKRWATLILLVAATLAGAAVFLRSQALQDRLLRADPNAIPGDSTLIAFARPRGASVFAARCANCHGAQGQGDPERGVPDLTDGDWLYGEGSVSDIEQVVDFGIRSHASRTWNLAEMPAFASPVPSKTEKLAPLSPGDIGDVTEFVFHLSGRPADPAATARGSTIFQERGGCYDCHGRDARGDSSIGAPNLTDRIWLYGDGSRQSIFDSIARGHHGVCPAWSRKLSPAAIREVAVYVYSLSHGYPAASSKAW